MNKLNFDSIRCNRIKRTLTRFLRELAFGRGIPGLYPTCLQLAVAGPAPYLTDCGVLAKGIAPGASVATRNLHLLRQTVPIT